jgi:hypothetical protein
MKQNRRQEMKLRKGETKVFTVTGRGTFPLDMLRYDSCWPYSSEDVFKMESDAREQRSIRLVTGSDHSPTIGRWNSFMWDAKDGLV